MAPDDVWAVGDLIEHWDGTGWKIAAEAPPQSFLAGVNGASSSDVWAVGQSLVGRVHRTLTEHYDGVGWSVVSSPSPDHKLNHLSAVSAVSADHVFSVGAYGGSGAFDRTTGSSGYAHTLVEQWDGDDLGQGHEPEPEWLESRAVRRHRHLGHQRLDGGVLPRPDDGGTHPHRTLERHTMGTGEKPDRTQSPDGTARHLRRVRR